VETSNPVVILNLLLRRETERERERERERVREKTNFSRYLVSVKVHGVIPHDISYRNKVHPITGHESPEGE